MIGRLHGILLAKLAPDLLIDVQGVGYEVQVPMSCYYDLPEVGQPVTLFTHFVVREDAQLLFGFNSLDERALFRLLIKAQGVGPKMALAIMSGMSAQHFVQSVQQGDLSTLVKIPGVGKKTAERLLVEMRDRLKDFRGAEMDTGLANGKDVSMNPVFAEPTNSPRSEALSALVGLGYKDSQAQQVLKKVGQDGMSAEELIRAALKAMM